MFSSYTNKFQHPQENRYGRKPTPENLNFNTETTPALEYLAPVAIRETLGITELEYYKKYQPPPKTLICWFIWYCSSAIKSNCLVKISNTSDCLSMANGLPF